MWPLIAGIGSALGSQGGAALMGGAAGIAGGLFSNAASAKQASKQRDFQYYMSNTAYRRAVKDMRRAGLNPVLAAGAPASTPGGAMGSTVNLSDAMSRGVNSALSYKTVKAGLKATKANVDATVAGQARTEAETEITKTEAEIKKQMWDMVQKDPQLLDAFLTGRAGKEVGPTGFLSALIGGATSAANKLYKTYARPKLDDNSAQSYRELNRQRRQWRKGFEKEQQWMEDHEGQMGFRNGKLGYYEDGKWHNVLEDPRK